MNLELVLPSHERVHVACNPVGLSRESIHTCNAAKRKFKLKRAARAQLLLSERVRIEPLERMPRVIAASDLAYVNLQEGDVQAEIGVGVTVFASYPNVSVLRISCVLTPVCVPYIPGYLAFRELPAMLLSYREGGIDADVVLVNGHGLAHPRGLGLASHLGVVLGKPTIGVARRLLTGEVVKDGGYRLKVGGRVVGGLVQLGRGRRVVVSVGNKITVNEAIEIVKRCGGERLPKPLSIADLVSKTVARHMRGPSGRRVLRALLGSAEPFDYFVNYR